MMATMVPALIGSAAAQEGGVGMHEGASSGRLSPHALGMHSEDGGGPGCVVRTFFTVFVLLSRYNLVASKNTSICLRDMI